MRSVVLTVIGLVLAIGVASATVPDPDNCSVTPCDDYAGVVTIPWEGSPVTYFDFTVNVRNADNDPIPNALTELVLLTPGNHFVCPAAVMSGTTDGDGNITFNPAVGGCTMDTNAIIVVSNGVTIAAFNNLKSPDFDGGANGTVELGDFAYFSNAMLSHLSGCTDFFNDGDTGLDDFAGFTNGWANNCLD